VTSSDGVAQQWPREFTRRERGVVLLVGSGISNKEIARQLGLSVGTVKTHVHNVLTKLDTELGARRRRWSQDAATAVGRERIREAQRRRWQRWRAARSADTT
jgi:DNA-binding NarL/FixJ family response regulator